MLHMVACSIYVVYVVFSLHVMCFALWLRYWSTYTTTYGCTLILKLVQIVQGYPEFYSARLYLSHGSVPPWRMDFNSAPHKPRVEHPPTRPPFSILNGSKETDGTAGNRWGNMRVRVTIRACEGGRGL